MREDRRQVVVLGAPMESEALLDGVNLMPAALRAAGLVDALGAVDLGDLPIAITDSRRDPNTGVVAFAQLCAATGLVRDGVAALLDDAPARAMAGPAQPAAAGPPLRSRRRPSTRPPSGAGPTVVAQAPRLPLVVGGCCGILVGIFAALTAAYGRVGLAFVDGHYDFYDSATSPAGALADMELRVLTGAGPGELAGAGPRLPLVDPADAWLLGCRDGWEMAEAGAPDPLVEIAAAVARDDAAIVAAGAGAVGSEAATSLAGGPGRYWLHVDLDVLSTEAMPAVDYLLPGGLGWRELIALLQPLAASPALVGMDVTIYNPTLDPERRSAPRIVNLLAQALGVTGPA